MSLNSCFISLLFFFLILFYNFTHQITINWNSSTRYWLIYWVNHKICVHEYFTGIKIKCVKTRITWTKIRKLHLFAFDNRFKYLFTLLFVFFGWKSHKYRRRRARRRGSNAKNKMDKLSKWNNFIFFLQFLFEFLLFVVNYTKHKNNE